jgi:hypothetical protein
MLEVAVAGPQFNPQRVLRLLEMPGERSGVAHQRAANGECLGICEGSRRNQMFQRAKQNVSPKPSGGRKKKQKNYMVDGAD